MKRDKRRASTLNAKLHVRHMNFSVCENKASTPIQFNSYSRDHSLDIWNFQPREEQEISMSSYYVNG